MTMNLAQVADINTIINQLNAQEGFDIAPDKFYDRQLFDALKLGNENYVHLKYAQSKTLPVGHKSLQMRRWGSLTPHTTPLAEGIPPKSDKVAMEWLTVSPTTFGRYMEFTDRVSMDQIDPQLAHYTRELSDLATRTLERYARLEMLKATTRYYGNQRANTGSLILGDMITFDTLRIITLFMERLMVKPLAGFFHVICSPEFLHDILMDPLVKEYMKLEQTGKYYLDGSIPPLFGIKLVKTMLDEFYTLELDSPGEYLSDDGATYALRVFKKMANGDEHYINIPASEPRPVGVDAGAYPAVINYRNTEVDVYLSDGSAIPSRVRWDIDKYFAVHALATTKTVPSTKVVRDANGVPTITSPLYTTSGADTGLFSQVPVHKSILLGEDALVKIGIAGKDNAKMFTQGLGSAGVNDPIHQRQSIGFKIDSVGLAILRDEACAVILTVPSQAIFTKNLSQSVMVNTFNPALTTTHMGNTY